MPHQIACRIASYGQYQHRAWDHLPMIGVRHVELSVPSPDKLAETKKQLADCGLEASSVQTACDVQKDDCVEPYRPQLAATAELGAKIAFLSAKAGDVNREVVYDRLRALGDEAGKHDVTISLETHPDLVTNGKVARETMQAVDHPRVRVNFDTANVYYYNRGVTTMGELTEVMPYVASLHLKDTDGGFETWCFPALGEGIVDFPAVFELLDQRQFTGPCTLEIEGVKGVEYDEAARLKLVADSIAYLQGIGAML